ncbi:MAG: GAF domain-containing sensor histidine kinase [Chloroflexi bacterium]|nr:GAF domain-containing sensor histidine kinase [Chloroflexota bacterium]
MHFIGLVRLKAKLGQLEKTATRRFEDDPRGLSMTLLKVLTVVAPAFFFWAIESIRNGLFGYAYQPAVITLAATIVATGAAFLFSRVVFGEIESIQREVVRTNEELTVLNIVASAVNESLSLEVVLKKALDEVTHITGADGAEIFLVDGETKELVPAARAGHDAILSDPTRLRAGEGPVGMAAISGEPVFIEDVLSNASSIGPAIKNSGSRSLACIPLISQNSVVGVFTIATLSHRKFSPDDLRLMSNTGNQIAVAIDNARLHQKVQAAAAIEERERLAREMHDGVAQVLSYINVKIQTAKSYLSLGQIEATQAHLQELEDTCQEAYADIRDSILGLRLSTVHTALVPALKEYVARFVQTTLLEVDLDVDEDTLPVLSPAVEVQMIRIIQEALTNVRKHAEAKRVWVWLSSKDHQLEVTIVDDGHGFDAIRPRKDDWPQFGLRIMKERAECIKGTLNITSVPGQGTRVELKVPAAKVN